MKKILLSSLLALTSLAHAEVFYEIQFNDTLGNIKQKYPNASYEKLKPAWLKPDEAFIQISGVGMQNELKVHFWDFRPMFRELLNSPENKDNQGFKEASNETDDKALVVSWVRVVYKNPVPIDVFKRKYGKSSCKIDDDFNEVCEFPDRSISANLTKDGKFVHFADTSFTKKEKISSFRSRGERVPDYLLKP